MESSKTAGIKRKLIVILGVVGCSFSSILVKVADAPSPVLVFYRMLLAALVMTVPCAVQLKREYRSIQIRDYLCSMISGIFLALHFTTFFESLRWTSIASSLVLTDTEVFFVAFLMLLGFREKISPKGWLGILLTFAGSVIVAAGDSNSGSDVIRGDLYALSAAFCMAMYTIMGKICRRHMSTTVYTTLVYWVAAIATVVILSAQGLPLWGYGAKNVACGFGMAILCTLLGHSVFSWGLKYLSAAFISTAKLLEPIIASILGIFLFRQIPGATAVIGGLLVIYGVAYYSRQQDA